MKSRLSTVSAWLLSAAMVVMAGFFGKHVPFSEQWPLYEALRTTAAIIFAVCGAWLAIAYPDRLRASFGIFAKRPKGMNERFSDLLTPIAHSSIILCVVLFIGILAPILRNIALLVEHAMVVRTASFMLLVALTLWQLFTVVLTLVPADTMKSQADQEAARQRSIEALRGLASEASRPDSDEKS